MSAIGGSFRPGLYIGLISGTSMDGIDAALVEIAQSKVKTVGFQTYPYSDEIGSELHRCVIESSPVDLGTVSMLHVMIGEAFAEATTSLLQTAEVDVSEIVAIGSHGQTVFHDPDSAHPFSLQLGAPSTIAAATGITTVADFRSMDMAYGGQGAPLVPAFHVWAMQEAAAGSAALNIGGIANFTIPSTAQGDLLGFDTGPGNCLMDWWCEQHLGQPYDTNGEWAASGISSCELLEALLNHPYFDRPPPKSTGRELFGAAYLRDVFARLPNAEIEPADVQATLLEFTVESIGRSIDTTQSRLETVYVCGGGAHNKALMDRLSDRMGTVKVTTFNDLGINPDAVEATTFAWMAARRLAMEPVLTTTGSQLTSTLLGAVYEPTRQ